MCGGIVKTIFFLIFLSNISKGITLSIVKIIAPKFALEAKYCTVYP